MMNQEFENKEVKISNAGKYRVYLHDPHNNKTRIVNPEGNLVLPFRDIRDFINASPGNKEIIRDFLIIVDPDVRKALDIDGKEVITDDMIESKLRLASEAAINKELKDFLENAGQGELDRIAQKAVDMRVCDMRILKLLERYTPYSGITKQIDEKLTEGLDELDANN